MTPLEMLLNALLVFVGPFLIVAPLALLAWNEAAPARGHARRRPATPPRPVRRPMPRRVVAFA